MPDTQYDANFSALQQNLNSTQAPGSGGGRTKLQESIIDSIPLAISAFADDNGQTTNMVLGILDRKKRQEALQFQNELDLRRLQLNAAIAGIQNERDKVESMDRHRISSQTFQQREQAFPLEQGLLTAQTRGVEANVDKTLLDIQESKDAFPLEQGLRRESLKSSRQSRQLSEDEFDLKALESQSRVEENKARAEAIKADTAKEKRTQALREKYAASDIPEERQLGETLLLGLTPSKEDAKPDRRSLDEKAAEVDPFISTWLDPQLRKDNPEVQAQYAAHLNNYIDEDIRPIAPLANAAADEYHNQLGLDRVSNPRDTSGILSRDRSNIFRDTVIRTYAPVYEDLQKDYGRVMDREFLDYANHMNPKLGMTGSKLKELVIKTGREMKAAGGQAEYLEQQLAPVLSKGEQNIKRLREGSSGSNTSIEARQNRQDPNAPGALSKLFTLPTREELGGKGPGTFNQKPTTTPLDTIIIIRPDGGKISIAKELLTPEYVQELKKAGFRFPGFE